MTTNNAIGITDSGLQKIKIFDTTLRDGEQSPGATMTFEEKLEVADLLDEMGVDVIEAGFPIASQGDFEAVHAVAKRAKHAVIAGLSRANAKDIDRCAEAVRPARRGRIHTVIATSPLHMKAKLQMEPEAVLQAVIDSVTRARNHGDRNLKHLLRRLVELVLHVQRRGRNHRVDAAALGELHRRRAAVDVVRMRPREPRDDSVLRAAADLADCLKVAFARDGETGLDDVDAHVVEHLGDLELFLEGHGGAGALFAVAQGGVEYNDAVLFGLFG